MSVLNDISIVKKKKSEFTNKYSLNTNFESNDLVKSI